jgi:hypothetical protein
VRTPGRLARRFGTRQERRLFDGRLRGLRDADGARHSGAAETAVPGRIASKILLVPAGGVELGDPIEE